MSNVLMSLSLSRAIWKSSVNGYGPLRHISCNKGTMLCSGDVMKPLDIYENEDKILSDLKSADSPAHILRIAHNHHRNMNEKHSVEALKTIFALQKKGNFNLSTNQLINHPDFEKICRNVKKHAGIIDLNDAVDTLKILTYVGVPATSHITQIILQIIKNNINSLKIPHILFVDYLLQCFEDTPLVEALRIALPIVFEINVPIKMNDTNPTQMADCLQYAINHNVSMESIDFIVNKLERYEGEFEANTARSIISSICYLPRNHNYELLINKATTDLIVNIDNVPILKMEIILNKLVHKYTKKFTFYYQEVLFDTCANYIIDHNIGYKRAINVLRNMARVHHVHKPLLDYVSTHLYNNPSEEKDPVHIYSLVISLVLTEYRPVYWDHLKEWINSAKHLAQENRKEIIWIRFAAALCVLDIYKIDVLIRALKEDYLRHLLIDNSFRSDRENYFVIWQCITAYKPDFHELLPSNFDPKDLIKSDHTPTNFLEGALQKALGGERFLLTNLLSKLGVRIEHAILFSNGSPVPFETKVEYVEDIKLEDSSQQLALIWLGTSYHYTINTNVMRALTAKTLSILEETLNCSVIPVSVDSWLELNDFEKIPYLMQKIKDKLDLDINVLESAV